MNATIKNLLKVKSLITIGTTIAFIVMLLTRMEIPQEFQLIYTTIISFYFGTQTQKIKDGVADVAE